MIVLDTNVLVVADADDSLGEVSPECKAACVDALLEAQHGRYALDDDDDQMVAQYQDNVSSRRPYGVAYELLVHVYQTQWDLTRAQRVHLTAHVERGWEEFPDDPVSWHSTHRTVSSPPWAGTGRLLSTQRTATGGTTSKRWRQTVSTFDSSVLIGSSTEAGQHAEGFACFATQLPLPTPVITTDGTGRLHQVVECSRLE